MNDRSMADAVDQRGDHDAPVRRAWGSTLRPVSADSGLDAEMAALAADATMRQLYEFDRSMKTLRRDLDAGLSSVRKTVRRACWAMVALVALASAAVVALSRAEGGPTSAASQNPERNQD
jgi:hypothetical protein